MILEREAHIVCKLAERLTTRISDFRIIMIDKSIDYFHHLFESFQIILTILAKLTHRHDRTEYFFPLP